MRKVRTLQLLSRRQVAKLCDCSPATICNAVNAGELRTVEVATSPGHVETRVTLESLLDYYEVQTGKSWTAHDLLELKRLPRVAEMLSLSTAVVYRVARSGEWEVLNAPGTSNRWGKRVALRSIAALIEGAQRAPGRKAASRPRASKTQVA